MSKEKNNPTPKRKPTFVESIIPIVAMLIILTVGKGVLGYATEPLLLLVAAVAGVIAYRVGVTWDEMMDEICQKIAIGEGIVSTQINIKLIYIDSFSGVI